MPKGDEISREAMAKFDRTHVFNVLSNQDYEKHVLNSDSPVVMIYFR